MPDMGVLIIYSSHSCMTFIYMSLLTNVNEVRGGMEWH